MLTLYPAVALFLCLLALFSFGGLCCIILRELFMFSTSVELGFSHFPLSFSVPYLFIFGRAEYFFQKLLQRQSKKTHFSFSLRLPRGVPGPNLDMFLFLIFHVTHYFFMISSLHSIFVAIPQTVIKHLTRKC